MAYTILPLQSYTMTCKAELRQPTPLRQTPATCIHRSSRVRIKGSVLKARGRTRSTGEMFLRGFVTLLPTPFAHHSFQRSLRLPHAPCQHSRDSHMSRASSPPTTFSRYPAAHTLASCTCTPGPSRATSLPIPHTRLTRHCTCSRSCRVGRWTNRNVPYWSWPTK